MRSVKALGFGLLGATTGVCYRRGHTRAFEHQCTHSFQAFFSQNDCLFLVRSIQVARPVMEAFVGAVGEVAQISILYPLETMKVKCQVECSSGMSVLRQLMQQGSPASVLRALYSGFSSAAICSIVVGAVHYASFCASKRLAQGMGRQKSRKGSVPGCHSSGESAARHLETQPGSPSASCSGQGHDVEAGSKVSAKPIQKLHFMQFGGPRSPHLIELSTHVQHAEHEHELPASCHTIIF